MSIIRDKFSDNHGDNFILDYSYCSDTVFSVFHNHYLILCFEFLPMFPVQQILKMFQGLAFQEPPVFLHTL